MGESGFACECVRATQERGSVVVGGERAYALHSLGAAEPRPALHSRDPAGPRVWRLELHSLGGDAEHGHSRSRRQCARRLSCVAQPACVLSGKSGRRRKRFTQQLLTASAASRLASCAQRVALQGLHSPNVSVDSCARVTRNDGCCEGPFVNAVSGGNWRTRWILAIYELFRAMPHSA